MSLLQEIETYGLADCEFNRELIKYKWYCVDIKGELWLIGEYSTEYEARQNAQLHGHDVVWLVDNKTAKQWFNTLMIVSESVNDDCPKFEPAKEEI